MNLAPKDRTVQENQAISQLGDRMASRFPEVDRGIIDDVVREEHASFAGDPVRDYIPVLVERKVKARLRAGVTRSLENAEA
jgi:hypothetical protein